MPPLSSPERRRFLFLITTGLLTMPFAPAVPAAETLSTTIARIAPSVVAIAAFDPMRKPPLRYLGTGFAVHDGRILVTNDHVVAAAGGKPIAAVQNGRRFALSVLLRRRDTDLALLRLDQGRLPPLPLGKAAAPGTDIAFTGYPVASLLGVFPVTHRGIVSGIKPAEVPRGNPRRLSGSEIRRIRGRIEVLQLDATAFPGNSGSPLYLPASGAVVGIVSSLKTSGPDPADALRRPSGIAYAVPVRYLRALLKDAGLVPSGR